MLDDLKTTVNKTTEHLNTLNSTKSRDVQFAAPANTTHVVEERTTSPIASDCITILVGFWEFFLATMRKFM